MTRRRGVNARAQSDGVRMLGAGVTVRIETGSRAVLPAMTEKQWQDEILTLARLFGWAAWHDNATNAARRCSSCGAVRTLPRNAAGWPDLVLIRPPRILFVELKSNRGAVTDDQQAWLEALRACGLTAEVWRPADFEHAKEVLR